VIVILVSRLCAEWNFQNQLRVIQLGAFSPECRRPHIPSIMRSEVMTVTTQEQIYVFLTAPNIRGCYTESRLRS